MDFNSVIDSIETIQISTKRNYKNRYKLAIELGILCTDSENVILTKIEALDKSMNFKNDLVTCFIVYKRELDLGVEKLRDYKKHNKPKISELTETNENDDDLPSLEMLLNFTNDLYIAGRYDAFIINFLLIFFNCRNKDLNLLITKNKEDINKEDNFLLVEDKSVKYIRNDYKTAETYGVKTSNIIHDKFLIACKSLIEDGSIKLLDCEPISMGSFIKYRTFNKIGQSRMNKVIVSNASKKDLYKISANRGTDISTLLTFYDTQKN